MLTRIEKRKLQLWQLHLNTMPWTLLINLDRALRGHCNMHHVPESMSIQTAVFYGNIYQGFSGVKCQNAKDILVSLAVSVSVALASGSSV